MVLALLRFVDGERRRPGREDMGEEPVAVNLQLDLLAEDSDEIDKLLRLRDHPRITGEDAPAPGDGNGEERRPVVLGLGEGVMPGRRDARVAAEEMKAPEAEHPEERDRPEEDGRAAGDRP